MQCAYVVCNKYRILKLHSKHKTFCFKTKQKEINTLSIGHYFCLKQTGKYEWKDIVLGQKESSYFKVSFSGLDLGSFCPILGLYIT